MFSTKTSNLDNSKTKQDSQNLITPLFQHKNKCFINSQKHKNSG